MPQELSSEDESYKYIIKNIGSPMLEKLGHNAENVKFNNVELIPKAKDKKYMDILCTVDGKYNLNIEPQSTPVYDTKMEDMYKYRTYTQCEESITFKTIVLATYNPNHGIKSLEIDEDVNFHPDFFFTQKIDARKIIKTIKDKKQTQHAIEQKRSNRHTIASRHKTRLQEKRNGKNSTPTINVC